MTKPLIINLNTLYIMLKEEHQNDCLFLDFSCLQIYAYYFRRKNILASEGFIKD